MATLCYLLWLGDQLGLLRCDFDCYLVLHDSSAWTELAGVIRLSTLCRGGPDDYSHCLWESCSGPLHLDSSDGSYLDIAHVTQEEDWRVCCFCHWSDVSQILLSARLPD